MEPSRYWNKIQNGPVRMCSICIGQGVFCIKAFDGIRMTSDVHKISISDPSAYSLETSTESLKRGNRHNIGV